MGHIVGQDDGELYQASHNLLFVVLVPRCLVDEFLPAFLRDGVGIRCGIVEEMLDDFLRLLVVALHQVAATGVAVDCDGFIVLIQDLAVFGADRDGGLRPL